MLAHLVLYINSALVTEISKVKKVFQKKIFYFMLYIQALLIIFYPFYIARLSENSKSRFDTNVANVALSTHTI